MDSIIFDLDGTLWDSADRVSKAWNEAVAKIDGVSLHLTVEDIKGVMGLPAEEGARKLLPDLTPKLRAEITKACFASESEYLSKYGGTLYPGVEEMLAQLSQRYKLFIVSNCQDGYIEAFFQYHQLGHYFTDYENPGRTGLSKGENIKLVMERCGLTTAVYVGDTAGDRKAAAYAGIPFVYARYGFGQVEDYDYAIEEPVGLLELF